MCADIKPILDAYLDDELDLPQSLRVEAHFSECESCSGRARRHRTMSTAVRDFSPAVQDFAAEGFTLVGGRMDYLAGRPVAAIVYHHKQHVINLLVWPEDHGAPSANLPSTVQGFNLLRWSREGMNYVLVSDLN